MPTFKINDKKAAEEIAKSQAKLAENSQTKKYKPSDAPRSLTSSHKINPTTKSGNHVKQYEL